MSESDASSASDQRAVVAEKRFAEICSNIRATDEVSFKLLGLVPLVSGVGILVLLNRSSQLKWSPLIIFVAAFGATITFAIYRWELCNIQTCEWLINRAVDLERDEFHLPKGQFYNRDDRPPKLFGWEAGKTQAVHVLYWTTIAAWLLLPVVAAIS